MTYSLVKVTSDSDWADYNRIRKDVLFEGREYDPNHPDEYISSNHPMLLKALGKSVATVRLDFSDNAECTIRLVAVTKDEQSKGHGRKLYELIEKYASENHTFVLRVNAAPDAVGYYKKMGFIEHVWDETELEGIAEDCIQMIRKLPS